MESIFAWTIIISGLVGGIVAPILTRKKIKSSVAHAIGWVGWFFFTVAASSFVISFVIIAVGGEEILKNTIFATTSQALTYLIMFGFMILLPWRQWLGRRKKGQSKKKGARRFILKISGLSRKPTLNDVKQFLSFFPLYFVTNIAVSVVMTLIVGAKIMGQEQNVGFANTGNTPLELVLIGLALVVLAPLFEEMLVRGALFGKLREKLKFWPAALLTASVFALIHGQFNVGVMTFILALYAAYLREKTGAIWSGIMLHATQNLIAFYLLFLN
ncbi:MAG: CPBP family intramembrane metalloprotease [Candidatus Nomurabacteria bacterium]|jgi:membrane protease YdiL (CAAX protease family)|nr:CPBP family intramembrane metalloprotease [Candidatus Nomurabacteria bacterium]